MLLEMTHTPCKGVTLYYLSGIDEVRFHVILR